jgi:hypothetical protein
MSDLPSFLSPLLRDTRGGRLKLLAAWDGLTVDSQIRLLDALDVSAVPDELARKASSSPNAYVRYLAARSIAAKLGEGAIGGRLGTRVILPSREGIQSWPWQDVVDRLRDDPDLLVRYALDEGAGWKYARAIDDSFLDTFLQQPLPARLAQLRGEDRYFRGPAISADAFAKLIRHAIHGGLVSEQEVGAMTTEYLDTLCSMGPKERAALGKQSQTETLDVLWRLVPDLPTSVRTVFSARLPTSIIDEDDAPVDYTIPDEALESMDSWLLQFMLWRDDVGCGPFRKKVALTYEPKDEEDQLIEAATHRHFDLTDEEFGHLLSSDAKRLRWMRKAMDMRPVLLFAAIDFLRQIADDTGLRDTLSSTYDRRIWRLRWEHVTVRRKHLWELRVYYLASDVASQRTKALRARLRELLINSGYSGRRGLREYIVPGDAWKTYLRLMTVVKDAIDPGAWNHAKWDAVLPKVYESELTRPEFYLTEVLHPSTKNVLSKEIGAAEKQGHWYNARRIHHMLEHPEYYELRDAIRRLRRLVRTKLVEKPGRKRLTLTDYLMPFLLCLVFGWYHLQGGVFLLLSLIYWIEVSRDLSD